MMIELSDKAIFLLHILMQTNKTEVMPIRLREPAFPTKKLSNIAEDLEI